MHPRKKSEITQMIGVGDGVWVSIKYDPTIRLFHASTFQHMQDLDISPPIHRMLGGWESPALLQALYVCAYTHTHRIGNLQQSFAIEEHAQCSVIVQ